MTIRTTIRTALVVKPGAPHTGVGRYARMLEQGLRDAGTDVVRVEPSAPPLPGVAAAALRRMGVDIRTFLLNYPVRATFPQADLFHFTSQNLASLLHARRPSGRIVVTIHDIIPYMLRNDRELCSYRTIADRMFDRLAVRGIRRADVLIADSEYTRQSVVEHLGIAPERLSVVHLGVDHLTFREMSVPAAVYERYGLSPTRPYILYAGSEDPRKNLSSLVRALKRIRMTHPDLELIKVGRAYFDVERQRLIALARKLDVDHAIHFVDEVPELDLPLLYNLAAVCVIPSLYEGFGFPVLEAMACGTPVVCIKASSLPELAGGAALLAAPGPDEALEIASLVDRILADVDLRRRLRSTGLARASQFQWERCVRQTYDAYGYASATSDSLLAAGSDA